MRRFGSATLAGLLVIGVVSGCGTPDRSSASSSAARGATVMVFAAASLKKTFTEIGDEFTRANPGTAVEFSFGGSSDLVTQLTEGARADVFASADGKNMDRVAEAGLLLGDPVNFASNVLTIAVAPGNPKQITSFQDLTKPGLNVVVCAPQVPCGSATRKLETFTAVTLAPVSEESSVTDVLNKVTSGQADAGLVYVTDAIGAGDKVTAVPIPDASRAVNTYPIATLKDAENADAAGKFVAMVTSPAGRAVLAKSGFGQP